MTSWLTRLGCTRAEADATALLDEPFPGIEPMPSLVASETETGWELLLYTEGQPAPDIIARLREFAPSSALEPESAPLPDEDWVTLSQAGLAPVDIGHFHIHAGSEVGPLPPGRQPIRIDAGLAFGTGQHATTSGCIATALSLSRRQRPRNVLDVGTGSGILAFVSRHLWSRAKVTAADLDPIAVRVAQENCRKNRLTEGRLPGSIRLLNAGGVEHRLITSRAPYDLVFANILAGPLIALAPSLSAVVAQGGHLVLAGLLQPQAQAVIAAYRAHGLKLVSRSARAEWPVLLFRRIRPSTPRTARRAARRETANRGWQIDSI